jgi:hypothetical protein
LQLNFSAQCKEVAKDFIKDKTSVRAFTGLCYDQKVGLIDASVNCTDGGNGQDLPVIKWTWSAIIFKILFATNGWTRYKIINSKS